MLATDKDKMIVRQSSLKAAVEFYARRGSNLNTKVITDMAEEFERWVLR